MELLVQMWDQGRRLVDRPDFEYFEVSPRFNGLRFLDREEYWAPD